MQLSILIPVYRSADTLSGLVKEIQTFFSAKDIEILLIDDASPDHSRKVIQELCRQYSNVRGFSLSKNLGQQQALALGISRARGEWILTLDDDGQHPLTLFPDLERKRLQGCDLIFGVEPTPKADSLRNLGFHLRDRFFRKHFPQLQGKRVSSLRYFDARIIPSAFSPRSFLYLSAELLPQAQKVGNVTMKKRVRPAGTSGYSLAKLVLLYGKLCWYYNPVVPSLLKPHSAFEIEVITL